ncbi:MAG: Trk family potassium uptake protein [Clostridia bacterium]|nr:Trk family potassium uptake protein [Clostridia bacterium]
MQIIALGYFLIVFVGTVLLMLPLSTASGKSPTLLTALFTSVSASCVTGLVAQNTATYWSLFGQIVILVLIQLGGLGYMTIATFFYRLVIHKRGLREKVMMAETINTTRLNNFSSLVKKIILGTLMFEGIGAALLSISFINHFGVAKGIYFAVFHSISAFCNAGFDLLGENTHFVSLMDFSGDYIVILTISALIIIGSLGFLVWDDITVKRFSLKKLNLHSKIVILTSVLLLGVGAVLFFIFEYNNLLKDMPFGQKLLNAFFASVTPRTAGFNSIDMATLSQSSVLLTVFLMFIGGSSGSTAGGVKTTSIFVIIAFAFSTIRGNDEVAVFGKTIKTEFLKKAILIITINLTLIICATLIICGVDSISLADALLETVSAMSTVGLTAGITTSLSAVSKIALMLLMFCGRVGSVSFASALFEKRVNPPISYPAEAITVG